MFGLEGVKTKGFAEEGLEKSRKPRKSRIGGSNKGRCREKRITRVTEESGRDYLTRYPANFRLSVRRRPGERASSYRPGKS